MPTLLNLMAYFRFYKFNTCTVPTVYTVNYQVKNQHYNLGSKSEKNNKNRIIILTLCIRLLHSSVRLVDKRNNK